MMKHQAPFAFGTHQFGSPLCPDADKCGALLDQYFEGGGRIIDTARAYQNGKSEAFVGSN